MDRKGNGKPRKLKTIVFSSVTLGILIFAFASVAKAVPDRFGNQPFGQAYASRNCYGDYYDEEKEIDWLRASCNIEFRISGSQIEERLGGTKTEEYANVKRVFENAPRLCIRTHQSGLAPVSLRV